ncbi:MAG: thioether cross-link-forming SCIFF peptide maturase [Tissierellia bacterium]|nr:thioether cross-link-forming SCIFF peptide maturase [Tissierellia bacterium]
MAFIHKFHLNDQYILLDIASGSVHLVDPMIYDLVDYVEEENLKEAIVDLKDKYKVEDIQEGYQELVEVKKKGLLFTEDDTPTFEYNKENIIKALCLHVAHDCNLRCKYCFAAQGNFKGQRLLMDEDTGKKAFDFLIKHSGKRKNLEVDFFGGEPLMNFSLIKKLVEYGRSLEKKYNKHFRFTITTNGILLDDDKIKYINENMDNVVLSLDGRKEINDTMRPTCNQKGSYETIVPKFKKLIDQRGDKDYYIRGTFTNQNLDFSKDVEEYYNLGFKKTSMEPVVTDEKEEYAIREEHLEKILKEYEDLSEKYIEMRKEDPEFQFFHFMIDLSQGPCLVKRSVGCGAGCEYVAITPEGDIYPCHQFVGEKDFILGNVHDGNLDQMKREPFRTSNVFSKEDCQSCWAKYYCSGGCHANAYYANQSIEKPYRIGCEMERKRLEAAISVLASETN